MVKILIDTDCGVDDAIAIVLAATFEKCEIVGITTVFGNTSMENASTNALSVLKHLNKHLAVPVFKGSFQPLLQPSKPVYQWPGHGPKGLGLAPEEKDLPQFSAEHAVNAISRLSKEHKGDLRIVTLGPLTNLALAVSIDPEIPSRISGITIV